ncbi:hypothetical protein ACFXJ8_19095 [Nonomuraea sp. NPDC059194]|uniref:hypothetical protein n=1 Tax=Nonomuraea sp. NPDC059194 TaxID=3346764 RepID=UPI0036965BEC
MPETPASGRRAAVAAWHRQVVDASSLSGHLRDPSYADADTRRRRLAPDADA